MLPHRPGVPALADLPREKLNALKEKKSERVADLRNAFVRALDAYLIETSTAGAAVIAVDLAIRDQAMAQAEKTKD